MKDLIERNVLVVQYYLLDITWVFVNHIDGVMVSMLTSSVVYLWVCALVGPKPKTITLVFSASLANHAALRSKSKDWLARNQDNVSE